MAGEIKIPVGAQLDQSELARVVQEFTGQMNRLGSTIAQANKLKFNPVDKAGLEDLKKVVAQFETLKKINPDLRRRLGATGFGSAGFHDVDWSRVYQGGQGAQRVYNYVGAGTAFSGRLQATPATPPPGGGAGGGGPAPTFPGQGIVNTGLNAAGPVGGVAARSINAGMSGGFGAGLGAMVGGLAALAVGKAVGAVREKVSAAENEFIGYDTMKRQLGDLRVSFDALKVSVREASKSMDVGFDEGGRLAGQFIRGSGGRVGNLYAELATGGGLSRSFGLDPSEGVGFLATMRKTGATRNADDSKRMGLLIGEGIAKSGAFAQAGEMMQAVASFATSQARMGMGLANIPGYTGMLAGALRSGIPGMDMGGASSLLGTVNSAIAGGGRSGEASRNFMLASLGRRLGLNPVQTMLMQEQGAFGTGAGTFGAGSTYARFAAQYGAKMPGGAAGSRATNLDLIMGDLKRQYGGNPDLMLSAISGMFGTSTSQSMALSLIKPERLGGMQSRLERLGINMGDVKASGISALAQLEGSGKSEAEKDAMAREIAKREQESTPGSEVRRTREGIENLTQEVAGKLVPLTTSIRDGVLWLAGGGKSAPSKVTGMIADAEYNEKAGPLLDRKKVLERTLGPGGELRTNSSWYVNATPEKRAQINAQRAQAEAELANINAGLRDLGRTRDAAAAGKVFAPGGDYTAGADALMSSLINAESGGNHYGPGGGLLMSPKGAAGITQVMPGTGIDPGYGVSPLQNNSPEEYRRFGRDYLAAMLRKYSGDKTKALGAYNWGPGNVDAAVGSQGDNWLSMAPRETRDYIAKVLGGQQLPAGTSSAGPGRGSAEAYAHIRIDVNDGKRTTTHNVKAKFGQPMAAGTQ